MRLCWLVTSIFFLNYDALQSLLLNGRKVNQSVEGAGVAFVKRANVNREYVYSVPVYQKYLTGLGELIIFEPWRENYHFSQPS